MASLVAFYAFAKQSVKVLPMYDNFVIIKHLMATLSCTLQTKSTKQHHEVFISILLFSTTIAKVDCSTAYYH